MNWHNTVLHSGDIHRFPRTYEELEEVLLDQAEASYKVSYQEGMMKVVEWLKGFMSLPLDDLSYPERMGTPILDELTLGDWQAFLEENGLDNKRATKDKIYGYKATGDAVSSTVLINCTISGPVSAEGGFSGDAQQGGIMNWQESVLTDEQIDNLPYIKLLMMREATEVANFMRDVKSRDNAGAAAECLGSARYGAKEAVKSQAEAAFKAGYEEGQKGCPVLEVQGQIYLEGKEDGIREVAQEIFEEIEKHLVSGPFCFSSEGKWVECAWYTELKAKYQEGQ